MLTLLADLGGDLTSGAALLAASTYVARTSWDVFLRERQRGGNGLTRTVCTEHSGLVRGLDALEKRLDRIETKLDEALKRP